MNKVIFYSFILFIFTLATGCGTEAQQDMNIEQWTDGIRKIQKVEVYNPESLTEKSLLTNQGEIQDFIDKLEIDQWESAKLPDQAKRGLMYNLYQEKTRKLGVDKGVQEELENIGKITLFKDIPYAEMQIKNLKLHFTIPDKVADSVRLIEHH